MAPESTPPVRSSSAGYSLLELLVVLAIMALIVVTAIPFAVGTIEKFSLASDTRLVAAQLRTFRQQALDRQRDVSLFATTQPQPGLKSSDGQFIALSSGTTASVFAAGGRQDIRISWDGSMSGTIIMTRGGKSNRIFAGELNGPIRVEPIP